MIELIKNNIDVDTYMELRQSVNFHEISREQAQKALDHSLYTVLALQDGVPVGMGRIVGDGAVICYVQDLVIRPEVQGLGVGSMIMNSLKGFVEQTTLDGTMMMFDLMCAKGREHFYEKHGFIARPTEKLGPGMIQYIRK